MTIKMKDEQLLEQILLKFYTKRRVDASSTKTDTIEDISSTMESIHINVLIFLTSFAAHIDHHMITGIL